mgnify:FL=1
MRYISKQEALSTAIEKTLKRQNNSIVEILSPVDLTAKLKKEDSECHDDELENCISGSFSVQVRYEMSKGLGMSAVHIVSGRFSDVSYRYKDNQHQFIVGLASIQ